MRPVVLGRSVPTYSEERAPSSSVQATEVALFFNTRSFHGPAIQNDRNRPARTAFRLVCTGLLVRIIWLSRNGYSGSQLLEYYPGSVPLWCPRHLQTMPTMWLPLCHSRMLGSARVDQDQRSSPCTSLALDHRHASPSLCAGLQFTHHGTARSLGFAVHRPTTSPSSIFISRSTGPMSPSLFDGCSVSCLATQTAYELARRSPPAYGIALLCYSLRELIVSHSATLSLRRLQ